MAAACAAPMVTTLHTPPTPWLEPAIADRRRRPVPLRRGQRPHRAGPGGTSSTPRSCPTGSTSAAGGRARAATPSPGSAASCPRRPRTSPIDIARAAGRACASPARSVTPTTSRDDGPYPGSAPDVEYVGHLDRRAGCAPGRRERRDARDPGVGRAVRPGRGRVAGVRHPGRGFRPWWAARVRHPRGAAGSSTPATSRPLRAAVREAVLAATGRPCRAHAVRALLGRADGRRLPADLRRDAGAAGRGVIGYYVHHQGRGHLSRLEAVAAHLRRPGRRPQLACRSPPAGRATGSGSPVTTTPRRTAATTSPRAASLHWAPRHHGGLSARMARARRPGSPRERPAAVVVDVSVEVALLVAVVRRPRRRRRPARATGPTGRTWPPTTWPTPSSPRGRAEPHARDWPASWTSKAWCVGGLSRFDGRPPPGPPTAAERRPDASSCSGAPAAATPTRRPSRRRAGRDPGMDVGRAQPGPALARPVGGAVRGRRRRHPRRAERRRRRRRGPGPRRRHRAAPPLRRAGGDGPRPEPHGRRRRATPRGRPPTGGRVCWRPRAGAEVRAGRAGAPGRGARDAARTSTRSPTARLVRSRMPGCTRDRTAARRRHHRPGATPTSPARSGAYGARQRSPDAYVVVAIDDPAAHDVVRELAPAGWDVRTPVALPSPGAPAAVGGAQPRCRDRHLGRRRTPRLPRRRLRPEPRPRRAVRRGPGATPRRRRTPRPVRRRGLRATAVHAGRARRRRPPAPAPPGSPGAASRARSGPCDDVTLFWSLSFAVTARDFDRASAASTRTTSGTAPRTPTSASGSPASGPSALRRAARGPSTSTTPAPAHRCSTSPTSW